ncbi:hypothetical protein P167DRAFT_539322 [Morchella conica CCBAS932]|uniref:Uncharacterized protein n=1 Tax=Morchella conica CCBAS932 TaxID=1392247 RepID=A0A3N4KRJ4_9PEZI|nr:hypothetical protein P167DRAFT_539322 [Morchella conica CCBAS932]
MAPSAPYEESKSLGSGGSMVARLKLKGYMGGEGELEQRLALSFLGLVVVVVGLIPPFGKTAPKYDNDEGCVCSKRTASSLPWSCS